MVDKRRSERLTGRFVVVVREKLATWSTTTEDVSARGCRIELKRPLSPGALVGLAFDMGPGVEPLAVHGQVAWARRTPPYSAGIAFLAAPRQSRDQPGTPAAWIDRILKAYVRQVQDGPTVTPSPLPDVPAQTPAPGASSAAAVVARLRPCPVIIPPSP